MDDNRMVKKPVSKARGSEAAGAFLYVRTDSKPRTPLTGFLTILFMQGLLLPLSAASSILDARALCSAGRVVMWSCGRSLGARVIGVLLGPYIPLIDSDYPAELLIEFDSARLS